MAKEADRPHFNSSIIQLEALFEQLHGDVKSLEALQHELSFALPNVQKIER
ncbi:hypothetical protein ACM615_09420 [Rahnella sp. PAMC25617]|jgi:hypothetical protein|uniref:hypothetical protein n=1 Tax=Rahnella TaxID=34037 RepID=UPI00142EBC1F|nr:MULTISPECIES: hypothetical protein [Rahnella]MDH2898035.1 hypothetical protein [Rahnella variigena]